MRSGVSAWHDFQPANFHRPADFAQEIADAGFTSIEVVGVEGPGCINPDLDRHWEIAEHRENLLHSPRDTEAVLDLALLSHHTMVIARPP